MLIVLIPAVAKEHQSLSSVFTTFIKPADVGIDSSPYIFLLGLLISQYTITGYDASAHMVSISSTKLLYTLVTIFELITRSRFLA